jgi:hypothetical protein
MTTPDIEDTAATSSPGRLERALRESVKSTAHGLGWLTADLRPLPDFLIVGTKRGGTTSMWRYLLSHPCVLPMLPSRENIKSPHYFYRYFDRGERWYRGHFASQPYRSIVQSLRGSALTGEASPYYLYDPRVPDRVAATLPAVRVIVMLRNPVNRAYSHYWERYDQGTEPLGFAEALAAEPGRLAGELDAMSRDPFYYSRAHDWYSYRDRGVYAPQVRRWLSRVDRERMLIVRSEDFYADPGAVMALVLEFLNLPAHRTDLQRRHNYRPAPAMDPAARADLTDFYQQSNRELYDLIERDLDW